MLASIRHSLIGQPMTLDLNRLHHRLGEFPLISFSHGGSPGAVKDIDFEASFEKVFNSLSGKKVVFLVRDPRDTIVSYFHELTKRERINFAGDINDFVRDEQWGIQHIISFYNSWLTALHERNDGNFILVSYEHLHEDTQGELAKVCHFFKINVSEDMISASVEAAKFSCMRKAEEQGAIAEWALNYRDINDKNSWKTRKGKVGSYKEELPESTIVYVEDVIEKQLHIHFAEYRYRSVPQ
jgi:hypothetical protein